MPTRITHFLHDSVVTGAQAALTSFSAGVVHVHDMQAQMAPLMREGRAFRGIVNGVHIKLTSAGDAAVSDVTMRICADAAGDEVLVPDTQADLVAGITTASVKSVAFKVDLPLHQILEVSGNLYLFIKVGSAITGNPVFAQSVISWGE